MVRYAGEQMYQQLNYLAGKEIFGVIIVDVKVFGAKGDGVTDDTTAIQRAINYAISIGKHEVVFPAGTYLYTTLTDTSGITFVGDGVTLNGTTPITLVSFATLKTDTTALKADVTQRGFNVMSAPYSAKGDWNGTTGSDDTAAIQAALNAAVANKVTLQPPGGSYFGTIPTVILPKGRYKISDELTIDSYARIISDDGAIIEQTTPGKRIFVNNTSAFDIHIEGITFLYGTNAIYLSNENTDQTMFNIVRCQFHLQTDYAIYTLGLGYEAAPTDYHMSANLTIRKCRFRTPRKILYNVCDSALVEDSWVFVSSSNFDDNTAAFKNAYGKLYFRGMFGVPSGMNTLPSARWVDNYNGCFHAIHSRFGAEDGGMPIVYHMGDRTWESVNPFIGSSITIENSQCFCGPAANPNQGIVCLINSIPQYVRVQGVEDVRQVFNNVGAINLDTYFTNPARLYNFIIEPNNINTGVGETYAQLLPYVHRAPQYDSNKVMFRNKRIGINEADPQRKIHLSDDQTDDCLIRFEKINGAILADYVYGGLEFYGRDGSTSASGIRGIAAGIAGGTQGEVDFVIKLAGANSTTLTERWRITSAGVPIVAGDRIRVATSKTPASATAAGTQGDICWDPNYIYVCVATNTWRRVAHATW